MHRFITLINGSSFNSFFLFIVSFFCLTSHSIPFVHCDIFSSTAHIHNLMHVERHLVTSLTYYTESLEETLSQVKMYLREFAYTAGQKKYAGTFANDLMDNPLQAFQLLKRLAIDWNKIKSHSKHKDIWSDTLSLMDNFERLLPKQEDLNGAALSLIRLQDTYNLNKTDLANGYINGRNSMIQMSGKNAFNNGYYGHSLGWFEEALYRAEKEHNLTASIDEITPFYHMAIDAIEQIDNDLTEKNYPRNSENIRELKVVEGDNDEFRRYQKLCRGEKITEIISTKNSDQRCFFSTKQKNPHFLIKPLKIERLSRKPLIVLFHDLINIKEIELLKQLSLSKLTRARIQTDEKESQISNSFRVSQTSWLNEQSHPIIERLNKRIEAATSLSVDMDKTHCELVQIANYGMGGHYVPHYDYLYKDKPDHLRKNITEIDKIAGDRIATLMFYLSDVLNGGATVFTRLGIRVQPIKGAALFWYNLAKNGEGLESTVHGACPLIMGEKWVANYWIRENGQMFRRPCSLNPLE